MVNEDVFRKVKARVGKRAKSAPNETDVSFRKAGLHVAEQSRVSTTPKIGASAIGTTTTDRGLTVSQLAQQLKHPAAAMRVSALKGFQNLLLDQKVCDMDQAEEIVRAFVGPASLVDISATVREEAFSLLQKLSVTSFSMALVLSGLNSLDPRQAIHAARVLHWLLLKHQEQAIPRDDAVVISLIPSLTRLLSPSTAILKGGNNKSGGGVLAASKAEDSEDYKTVKQKKRKKRISRTTEDAPNTDRLTVLLAIHSVLMYCPGIGSTKANGRNDGLKVLRDLSDIAAHLSSESPSKHQVNASDGDGCGSDLVVLMAKLRDVLLEENQTDFFAAADCFRCVVPLIPFHNEQTDKLCEQVAKVAYNNGSILLVLALAQNSRTKDRTKYMKLVLREAASPATVNETFLAVAAALLESRELEITEKIWNAMKQRFFASTSTTEDIRSFEHRLAVHLVCNNAQASSMEGDLLKRFPKFLVAWRGDFRENSILCLDRMKTEANKPGASSIEDWRSSLEPLFEVKLFGELDKTVQHRLICLVTTLGSPTPTMVRHWSSWIASDYVAASTHNYTSLMIQCMHGIRQQMSIKVYLGFLIDSTGLLMVELLSESNCAKVEARIEEVCWALRQIGPAKVLPKLVVILTTMIDQGKIRLVAKVLSQFALDLDEGESLLAVLPDEFSKRLVDEFCRILLKQPDEVTQPVLDLLREDSVTLQCVLSEIFSARESVSDPAMDDLDRLLDLVLNEVILPTQHWSVPAALLSSLQSLAKPSSALYVKLEGIKRSWPQQ